MNREFDMKSFLMGRASGGGGSAPSGTLDITANGTYDVGPYASAAVNVSEEYDPYPNDTRLSISLSEGRTSPRLGMAVNGTARIDWGDGSPLETVTGDSDSTILYTPHTYAKSGDYQIYILVDSGKVTFRGATGSTGRTYVLTSDLDTNISNMYVNAIRAVRIREKTILGTGAFHYCEGLLTAEIRSNMGSADSAFRYCRNLQSVTLDAVGDVAGAAFQYCRGLSYIKVLPGTTAFSNNTLSALYAFGLFDLSDVTSAPSLIYAPSGWPEDVVILVPSDLLETFQTKSNWSDYADNMQGV